MKKLSSSPFDRALRFISFRNRSEAEVVNFLKRKRIDPQEITSTLTKLKDLLFVDDAKFASWWQESRDHSHPIGASLIKQELRQKGVAPEIINQTINADHKTEVKRAQNALAKKRQFAALNDPKLVQTAQNFLTRRGFSWEVISTVIEEQRH